MRQVVTHHLAPLALRKVQTIHPEPAGHWQEVREDRKVHLANEDSKAMKDHQARMDYQVCLEPVPEVRQDLQGPRDHQALQEVLLTALPD
jgi:hypothetical protein